MLFPFYRLVERAVYAGHLSSSPPFISCPVVLWRLSLPNPERVLAKVTKNLLLAVLLQSHLIGPFSSIWIQLLPSFYLEPSLEFWAIRSPDFPLTPRTLLCLLSTTSSGSPLSALIPQGSVLGLFSLHRLLGPHPPSPPAPLSSSGLSDGSGGSHTQLLPGSVCLTRPSPSGANRSRGGLLISPDLTSPDQAVKGTTITHP